MLGICSARPCRVIVNKELLRIYSRVGMNYTPLETSWAYYMVFDELRYYGCGRKLLLVWIDTSDVEIHSDKYYEINRVILWSMDKYLGSVGY